MHSTGVSEDFLLGTKAGSIAPGSCCSLVEDETPQASSDVVLLSDTKAREGLLACRGYNSAVVSAKWEKSPGYCFDE